MGRIKRLGLTALVAALMVAAIAPIAESRSVTRTKGTGWWFDISWTENDPDNLLGLPGNVHVGFMFGYDDQWGRYIFGNITDWECDPGETPGGHGFAAVVVEDTAKAAERAAENTVDEQVDSGVSRIDADAVVGAVRAEVSAIQDAALEHEFPPTCDFVQERSLDGSELKVTVDHVGGKVTITGPLIVTGGHGGGGPVLGRPLANITITGGTWEKYDWSSKYWGDGYRYADARTGTNWWGGKVSGSIGAMGFDDDPDDVSFSYYTGFSFKTVERIR